MTPRPSAAQLVDVQPHWVLRTLVCTYHHVLSPVLHTVQHALTGNQSACRFQPTCSEYATLAIHLHGPGRGVRLALRRVLRCHPFAAGGFDPVPLSSGTSPAAAARHLP